MQGRLWIIALLFTLPATSARGADCAGAVGDWNWSIGAVIRFTAAHTVIINGTPFGQWACTDPRNDVLTLTWNNGFKDRITFDRDRASAVNQIGVKTSGTRAPIASTDRPVPAPSAANPLAANTRPTPTGGTAGPVTPATGALQRCLGITPGGAAMHPGPATQVYCQQLPASDAYDRALSLHGSDPAGAVRLMRQAAEGGHPLAQLRLAMLFEAGDGVRKDLQQAFAWYGRAAAQGEPVSQQELGGYYEDADVVPENWDLAARLYLASGTQGSGKGQFAIGRAYQFGIGVPQSRDLAIEWFTKAAAQGDKQADYYAKWLRDRSNNIGFRNEAEQAIVMKGRLRFALGAADPAGIAFHASAQRVSWLETLGAVTDASEQLTLWQLRKDEYDGCRRTGQNSCRDPGPRPR